MKHRSAIILLLTALAGAPASAQVEAYIPFPDTSVLTQTLNHVLDNEGNLYVLAGTVPYAPTSQQTYEGPDITGRVIVKTSPSGALLWQRFYNTVTDPAATPDLHYADTRWLKYAPAAPIHIDDAGAVLLPHATITGEGASPVVRIATTVIDPAGGSRLRTSVYKDSCCSSYDLEGSFYHDGQLDNFFSRKPYNSYDPILLYLERRQGAAGAASLLGVADSNWNPIYRSGGITRDPYAGEYLYFSYGSQLTILSEDLHRRRSIRLYNPATQTFSFYRMTVNRDYYAINCAIGTRGSEDGNQYLIILDKQGREVSRRVSPRLTDLVLADDNSVWTLEQFDWQGQSPYPIAISQFSLMMRPLRQLGIGSREAAGVRMSIHDGRELVVSGIWSRASWQYYPDNAPAQVYVYRRAISDIPLLPAGVCEKVSISPNPVTDRVRIEAVRRDPDSRFQISVWSAVGQRVLDGTFNGTHEMSLQAQAPGVYFVELTDPTNKTRCLSKILKY